MRLFLRVQILRFRAIQRAERHHGRYEYTGLTADQVKFIGVRPEMFTIVDEDTGGFEHEVQGTVTDTDYYGDMTYYTVALDGAAEPVMISVRNTAGRAVSREGTKVTVGWGADSIVLLE